MEFDVIMSMVLRDSEKYVNFGFAVIMSIGLHNRLCSVQKERKNLGLSSPFVQRTRDSANIKFVNTAHEASFMI